MPDLYLYLDGTMVDQIGKPASGPVQKGNFINFSNIPRLGGDAGTAYDYCNIDQRGNGGNPWNVSVPPLGRNEAGTRPNSVRYCDDMSYFEDTSSP